MEAGHEHGFRHANSRPGCLHRFTGSGRNVHGEPRRVAATTTWNTISARARADGLVYQALHDRAGIDSRIVWHRNHEEDNGYAVSPVSAAVILADKSDVHRSRVRKSGQIEFDIHDRVNFAAEQSFLRVDSAAKTVSLELTIDTQISQVMEYFEIFLGRMQLCRLAAEVLDCRFKLLINGAELA
jgi:hypothetical protein